ncbi:hypothetical protein PLESTB_001429200 [Pleodorina starrii]|uniref:Protein kinase domain-containing protein n=1 Tax=Pleodorina starrii TaxID=330485 RepID=A0A9W6F7T2_9CHLO|nr:hypothetical protein PLESTB_001429200 [Pleodorina starrii]
MAENGAAATSVSVPEWAVATSASHVGDTMMIPSGPGAAGTGAHSLETGSDSQRTCVSNPNSDHKGGRLSALRNVTTILPVDSASGVRPSPIQRVQADSDVEKGTVSQQGANTDVKSIKRAPNSGSPLGSRQLSFKSVVPDLPAWEAAAGIKSSALSDSTSTCCGRILNGGDETGGKAVPLCSKAWWQAAGHGVVLECKKIVEVVRLRPLVLAVYLAVLGLLMGLGLWAVIAASSAEERFRHDSATKYYPPQPSNLNAIYPNRWYLINKNFDKLAKDLIALTKAGSVRTVSAIPHGVIRTMYPLNGTTVEDDRNWGAIGKNWLNDSVNAAPVKLSLSSHNLTIIGPYKLVQGGIGIVGMQAIFVNASQNATFDIPPGPDGATGPTSSIPGMLDLTWQPSYKDMPKFWGLCTVLLSWDFLRDNVTYLQDLSTQGYDYVLTRPDKNNTNLAVDWSPSVDPPRPPGFNATAEGTRPLIYYNLPEALRDPVIVKVPLPNVEWTLYVCRTGGWVPSWRAPLIAMVVVLSLVLSLLVFAVLVSRVQQRMLLRDVVNAAGQLAATTRTLEEEKNRMQALLARHFDLIDLLEGGTGGVAGSLQPPGGGGGSGGADGGGSGDGGLRPRMDILRQKMLLTGTSLRREQLGEAEQVTVQELLGEGTFGKVYKGLWRGTEVAIKTIVLPAKMSGKEKREKMAVMEAAISSSLAHPNVVQTYTYHIRPLRDSSAPASVAPPSPVPLPAPASGAATTAAAAAAATTAASGDASGTRAAAGATTADALGRTQILADAGAIVMGSPDSSISTASVSIQNTPNNTPNPGDASGGAGGAGSAAAAPAAVPAPAALQSQGQGQGAAGAGPSGTGAVTVAATGARGVSMDQPAAATSGIHSYEVQLVLEFCDKGCLRDALNAGAFFSAEGLNYPAILETAADIAKAMLHLHLNDVLHSDLKATNVMLKSTGSDSGRGVIAKVADFGLSVRLDHTATHISHAFQGSLTHMAPEVMLQGHVSRAADVYAFGITMWEIFTGGLPYRGTPGALLGHQTSKEGRRPVFPVGTPAPYKELAERCWHADAAQRPPFSEILDLLTKLRSEIPGPTPLVQTTQPLHKKMEAALSLQQQQKQQQQQSQQQQQQHPAGAANGGTAGIIIGGGGGGGSFAGGSGVGNGMMPLHKIGGPAAILVGGRLVSLSSAMQSADSGSSGGRMLPGNSAAAGATLGGLGFPGVLETISEEAAGGGEGGSGKLPAVAVAAAGLATAVAGGGGSNGHDVNAGQGPSKLHVE